LARLLPFGGAGADKIALHVRQPAEIENHQSPGAGAGVGPRFSQGSKLRFGVHDALDDANRSKMLCVSRSIRVTVATSSEGRLAEHPVKLAPVTFSR
jgi:hypothetical protein